KALHQASTARTLADQRTAHFQEADREVGSALRRLEELRSENDRLTRQRLDQTRIETLAERQKELAERAAELAARDPVRDPAARSEAERLKREQAEVADMLRRLAEQSELL